MSYEFVTANAQPNTSKLPSTIEEFLVARGLLPRIAVVDSVPARILF